MVEGEKTPTNNAVVFGFCEWAALMLGLPAGEALYRRDPIDTRMVFFAVIGGMFAILGPGWPLLKTRFPRGISETVVRMASDARWSMAILLVTMVMSFRGYVGLASLAFGVGCIAFAQWLLQRLTQTPSLKTVPIASGKTPAEQIPARPTPTDLEAAANELNALVSEQKQQEAAPSHEELAVLYGFDTDGLLILTFPSDRANKNEDALYLLLYGYKYLSEMDEVPVAALNTSLARSGCRRELSIWQTATGFIDARPDVDRIAEWGIAQKLLHKHGLSQGGFYSLTDTGLATAKLVFRYMVEHAA